MSDASYSPFPQFVFALNGEPYDHPFELDARLIDSLSRRHVVLLDTSVWIRLADRRDELASHTADKLRRLNDQEKIICPLAPTTIWELRKQTGPSLLRMAELMESLSENVTFRSLDQLFDHEIESFLSYLLTGVFKPLSLAQKFGPLLSYLAPGYRLTNASTSVSPQGISHICGSVTSMRLTTLVLQLGDKSCPPISKGFDPMSACKQRRELAGNSVALARRIEMEFVAREYVIPRMNKVRATMAIADQLRVMSQIDALPKSRRYGSAIEHILRFTPALSALVEVQTMGGLDITRKNSLNDFFDLDLMTYALAYSGTFVAIDKWLTSLNLQFTKARFPGFFAFANSLEALNSCLDHIRQPA